MVIACDGSASPVRALMGMPPPRETIPGISMEMELVSGEVPDDRVAVLTGEDTAKGFFSWIIPSFPEKGFRIGLSSISGEGLKLGIKRLYTDSRISRFLSIKGSLSGNLHTISRVYGSLPMGQPGIFSKGPVILLGDSAGMAKPTSGGGIYPSLMASDLLARTIKDQEPGERSINLFLSRWRKGYGKELAKAMLLRKIVRELEDGEIEMAFSALDDERKLEMINEKGDIDQPVQLAIKLLKMDPKMITLIPRFVGHLRRLII
jgi:flavin-dependent dehydrogenase